MKTKFYSFFNVSFILLCSISTIRSEKTSFTLFCPPDVSVSCLDEIWNLSVYGIATIYDGYSHYAAGNPTVRYNLNYCNTGTITRTWTVEDYFWQWHSCTQTIYVSCSGSTNPSIRWPEDIELYGCNPETNANKLSPPNNYPTWEYSSCSMLGRSYSDMLFTVNGQCKKIMRTWKVMDWNQYSSTYGYKIWSKVQTIYIINNTPPVVQCPADITLYATNCQNAELLIPPLALDPGTCGDNFEITNNSPYSASKGKNISGVYPIGNTKVTYTIKYACGNVKYCFLNVLVVNGSKPVPYCLAQMSTALMGVDLNKDGKVDNGMVEIWAKDLSKGSYSLCGNQPLSYSFSSDIKETSKTFTCDHIGKNSVQIWVTDSKGAQDFCMADIIVQNNGANIPNCSPIPDPVTNPPIVYPDTLYKLRGKVFTLADKSLQDVKITALYTEPLVDYYLIYDTSEVVLLDSFINMSGYKIFRYNLSKTISETKDSVVQFITKSTVTDIQGNYVFDSLSLKNKPLKISASYTDSVHRYIDQSDVLLLSGFVNGQIHFSSYHQYLASDINEDGIVDTTDLTILRLFVEGEIDSLPGKFQWYLIDASAAFSPPQSILSGSSSLDVLLDSIQANQPKLNFIAFKKGDISVDPNLLYDNITEQRQNISSTPPGKVFPNPFENIVQFDVSDLDKGFNTISIFDIRGLEVLKTNFILGESTLSYELDLSSTPTGILFYQIISGNKTIAGKLFHLR